MSQSLSIPYTGSYSGILYWLGTHGNTKPWENPVGRGIRLSVSSIQRGNIEQLIEPNFENQVFFTKNLPDSWFMLEFLNFAVRPTAYTLAHRAGMPSFFIRSWVFEASANGTDWVTLSRHFGDTSLNEQRLRAIFPVPDIRDFFQMFRIRMQQNSSGTHALVCCCFDIFGDMKNATPLPSPQPLPTPLPLPVPLPVASPSSGSSLPPHFTLPQPPQQPQPVLAVPTPSPVIPVPSSSPMTQPSLLAQAQPQAARPRVRLATPMMTNPTTTISPPTVTSAGGPAGSDADFLMRQHSFQLQDFRKTQLRNTRTSELGERQQSQIIFSNQPSPVPAILPHQTPAPVVQFQQSTPTSSSQPSAAAAAFNSAQRGVGAGVRPFPVAIVSQGGNNAQQQQQQQLQQQAARMTPLVTTSDGIGMIPRQSSTIVHFSTPMANTATPAPNNPAANPQLLSKGGVLSPTRPFQAPTAPTMGNALPAHPVPPSILKPSLPVPQQQPQQVPQQPPVGMMLPAPRNHFVIDAANPSVVPLPLQQHATALLQTVRATGTETAHEQQLRQQQQLVFQQQLQQQQQLSQQQTQLQLSQQSQQQQSGPLRANSPQEREKQMTELRMRYICVSAVAEPTPVVQSPSPVMCGQPPSQPFEDPPKTQDAIAPVIAFPTVPLSSSPAVAAPTTAIETSSGPRPFFHSNDKRHHFPPYDTVKCATQMNLFEPSKYAKLVDLVQVHGQIERLNVVGRSEAIIQMDCLACAARLMQAAARGDFKSGPTPIALEFLPSETTSTEPGSNSPMAALSDESPRIGAESSSGVVHPQQSSQQQQQQPARLTLANISQHDHCLLSTSPMGANGSGVGGGLGIGISDWQDTTSIPVITTTVPPPEEEDASSLHTAPHSSCSPPLTHTGNNSTTSSRLDEDWMRKARSPGHTVLLSPNANPGILVRVPTDDLAGSRQVSAMFAENGLSNSDTSVLTSIPSPHDIIPKAGSPNAIACGPGVRSSPPKLRGSGGTVTLTIAMNDGSGRGGSGGSRNVLHASIVDASGDPDSLAALGRATATYGGALPPNASSAGGNVEGMSATMTSSASASSSTTATSSSSLAVPSPAYMAGSGDWLECLGRQHSEMSVASYDGGTPGVDDGSPRGGHSCTQEVLSTMLGIDLPAANYCVCWVHRPSFPCAVSAFTLPGNRYIRDLRDQSITEFPEVVRKGDFVRHGCGVPVCFLRTTLGDWFPTYGGKESIPMTPTELLADHSVYTSSYRAHTAYSVIITVTEPIVLDYIGLISKEPFPGEVHFALYSAPLERPDKLLFPFDVSQTQDTPFKLQSSLGEFPLPDDFMQEAENFDEEPFVS